MKDNKNIIIELKNVSKHYEQTYAVEDFNLYVKKGEFITFLGPSGCGKTTTLRMIAGFELPTSGEILLNGKDISTLPPYERPVNTVFQRYALFPHLDVYDNIAFGLKLKKVDDGNGRMRKLTTKEISEKVRGALKIVDLEEYEDRDISTLSGGQQQRIAIARAIVNEPEILLLDEPLGALDLKMRKDMQLELKEMHKKLGITFIYVTHDQEEALTLSDTVVVMKDGMIQQIGTPEGIYNEPANAFVADFIGQSNIYSGTVIDKLKVRFLGHIFDALDEFDKNEKVDVVVRPEDVKIVPPGEGMVNGRLVSKIFKGIHYEYLLMVGRSEVVIQDTRNLDIDKEVGIIIEPDGIHIMKKELTANVYDDAYIDKNNNVVISDCAFPCDVTQLVPGSALDSEGYVIGPDGAKYDFTDADVKATIGLDQIEILDNVDEGTAQGNVVSLIYKGDHYMLTVRTEEDEDFVLDTEYTYDEGDRVGIRVKPEHIGLTLKGEAGKYVKK
ncbi:MAG: ATP-binding cassette domain-containing protein [Oscillospiraceae bacterium]|nr:ATP-binding cassette domain-containing protein [Oscillospiraceae bacterium]